MSLVRLDRPNMKQLRVSLPQHSGTSVRVRSVAVLSVFLAAIVGGLPSETTAAVTCSIAATTLAFGNFAAGGPTVDTTSTLSLSCSGAPSGTDFRVCVDINGGSVSDATSRQMGGPGVTKLRYELYSDAARTSRWGSWSAGLYGGGVTWDVHAAGSTVNASKTIYGRVLSGQPTAVPGYYSTTLTVFAEYQKDTKGACPDIGEGNTSTAFTGSATVLASCSVTTTSLNFGSRSSLGSSVDATGSLSVTCSNTLPYEVGLSNGNGPGAIATARKMTSGANTVTYSLYSDSLRTSVWGDVIGTNTVSGTGTGGAQSLTVYGRVPPQTTPPAATYSDNIVVTVTY